MKGDYSSSQSHSSLSGSLIKKLEDGKMEESISSYSISVFSFEDHPFRNRLEGIVLGVPRHEQEEREIDHGENAREHVNPPTADSSPLIAGSR